MKRLFVGTVALVTCLLIVTATHALTISYGKRDITDAGPGCVGGWISDHNNTAYFCGDTEVLNAHLVSLAADAAEPMTIVLHSGTKLVDNPEEQPFTGFGNNEQDQLVIDWSTRKTCQSDDVLTGRCECNRRNVTVDVWIANEIRLRELRIPSEFAVKSGGEIEQFIKSRATHN